jgi:hypothetical protein
MAFDFSWLSGLMGGAGQAGGSTSALGGLAPSGDMGAMVGPAAGSAAQGAGVGSNPFGFSTSGAGSSPAIDPKILQSVLSQVNGGQQQPRQAPSAGIAPRGAQVQLNGVQPQSAAALPAERRGLARMVYGS